MLTKTQEQILTFLTANQEDRLSIRNLAKKLNKSYTLVYNNLLGLEKKDFVRKLSVPPAQIVTLNEFSPVDTLVAIELKRKSEFLEKNIWCKIMLKDLFSAIDNVFFIFIIFGSYAKGKATASSDLDLLVIVNRKEDIKDIEDGIRRIHTKVKKSLIAITAQDFQEMIKNTNELNIGNESRKNHVILHGAENYYQLLRKTYKR